MVLYTLSNFHRKHAHSTVFSMVLCEYILNFKVPQKSLGYPLHKIVSFTNAIVPIFKGKDVQ